MRNTAIRGIRLHVSSRRNLAGEFETEKLAELEFDRLMEPYFHLLSEVRLKHHDGSLLRIDRVGVPRNGLLFPWLEIVGFELKKSTAVFRDLTKAMNQAIDYRDAVIVDRRVKKFSGRSLPFIFVFPDSAEGEGDGMYRGAIRQAGRRNIGLVRHEQHYGTERIVLRVAGERLWSSEQGSSGSAMSFGTARGRGSA